jgi:uncharacterized lipoprotein YddW (UPF0748 family)
MIKLAVGCFALVFFLMTAHTSFAQPAQKEESIPSPPREFRGVWVATVANIDWPSTRGLTTEGQKNEAIAILDKAKELNFNGVVFQVRPQADALYKSDLEPWSSYLTGQQGKAPDPFYDPLEFWVKEAHARGLELHAWFNPYRANSPANRGGLSDKSIVKAHPELVLQLGNRGYYWMNPALKGVQDHSTAVVMDVVKRYDIDGVHFDDYFYPYREYNDGKDFPDDESWKAYQESGGKLARNDWRRDAVNTFIKRCYNEIKATKPHVKFGISPFGMWRPGYPPSIRGFDQYDILYADAKLWLNEGWVDYYTPQLYWRISDVPHSFPVLLGWWVQENTKKRHLWPGLALGRGSSQEGGNESVNQIMVTRGMVPDGPGNVFFSMRGFMRDRGGLNEALLKGPYKLRALVPTCPWLDSQPPEAPEVKTTKQQDQLEISWKPTGKEEPFLWVLYTKKDGNWSYEILPSAERTATKDLKENAITGVAVSAVDRTGNESEKMMVKVE